MFSIEKSEILNPLWIGKVSNENTSTAGLHSKQWFHEKQEAEFK